MAHTIYKILSTSTKWIILLPFVIHFLVLLLIDGNTLDFIIFELTIKNIDAIKTFISFLMIFSMVSAIEILEKYKQNNLNLPINGNFFQKIFFHGLPYIYAVSIMVLYLSFPLNTIDTYQKSQVKIITTIDKNK